MNRSPPSTYSTNKSMNGGFNLTKKQSKRHYDSSIKKLRTSIRSLKPLRKAKSTKPRNVHKCSGGLRVKGSSLKTPKPQPLMQPFLWDMTLWNRWLGED